MTGTYRERLVLAMDQASVKQAELAGAVGISQQTVQHLRKKGGGSRHTVAIANFLGVTPQWLDSGAGPMRAKPATRMPGDSPLGYIPLLSDVQAGRLCDGADNAKTGDVEDWVPCCVPMSGSSYALRIQGDSMRPAFAPGEIVAVDPEREHEAGRYVVVKRADDEWVMVKKLLREGPEYFLEAVNPEWPDRILRMTPEWQACGVIVYSYRVHI